MILKVTYNTWRGNMDSRKRKIVAVFFTLTYVSYAYINLLAAQVLAIFILSLIPLCLIFFAEPLGHFQGYIPRGGNINVKTHPVILEIIGWILLIALLVFVFMKIM
jgi:hypothetical protein